MADLFLDWGELSTQNQALTDTGGVSATVETGGVAVDISFAETEEGASAKYVDFLGYVEDGEPFDPNSNLKLFGDGQASVDNGTNTSVTTLDFRATDDAYADSVQNVSFRLSDVDFASTGEDLNGLTGEGFQDIVTILAYDADGNAVPVTITSSGAGTVSGDTATGTTTTNLEDADGSFLVNIAGPVSRIEILYDNGGLSGQAIMVSDVHFSTVDPVLDLPPVANDDLGFGDEDTAIVVNVLGNDSDPEGQPLTVTSVTDPANGTVSFTPEGELTYTPNPDFNGTDTVTYTVTDPTGLTDTATVTFTVDPVNDSPVAVDDELVTDEDTPLTINVLGNDSDPEGQAITVVDATDPANGTISLSADGTLTYTPNPDFNGTDEMTYTIADADGVTSTATVFITVNPTPDAPVAEDDEATGDEDTPIVVNVLDNDVDPDGDPLTVTDVTEPANGTVTFTPEGEITYTPDPDFTGEDTVTYTVTDPDGLTDTATVTFTVDPTPDAPVAEDDALETDEDTPLTINILDNDSDPDGQPLEVTDVTQPANGTVTVTPEGELTYTPNPDFNGTEEVTYTVTDPDGLTDTATVFITVNPTPDAPVAEDDEATGDEDTPIVVNVLDNDVDPDGDPLTVTDVTEPANGTVTFTPEGELTYTPDPDFTGTDTVTYTVTDPDGLTDTATVTFTVDPTPDAPVAADDELVTDEDTPLTINVLGNDSDPDGQPLEVTDVTQPANGTVTVTPEGELTYTPNPDFNGTEEVTYTVTDPDGLTDTATVFITVNPTPDAPVAADDEATGDEDTPIVVNVLDNDVDPDGDPLTVTDVTEPANGTVTFTPEGEITYTPDPDFTGEDTVTYTVTDPDGLTDTATVTFTVDPTPDAPVAEDDALETDEDTPLTINILDNDSDPDGQPLEVTDVTQPANGTVTVTPEGELTYTPNPDFNGTEEVTYTVTDPDGLTDTATVFITVNPTPDAPVAEDDEATGDEDTPIVVNVLDNDVDPDGDPLTVTDVTEPANGTVTFTPEGELTYTPDPDFTGTDTVTYTVTDPDGLTDTATVTFTVDPTPDAPVAADDELVTDEDTPLTINVLGNDSDPDGQPLEVTDVTQPANGTVTVTPEGELTYTPNPDFNGTEEVTYTVTDPDGLTDTATVFITVNPTPDAPVAADDEATGDEDTPIVVNVLDNDVDPDGDPLTVTDVTEPANGTVTFTPEGEITYTPDPDFTGTDTVTYTVTDPDGLTDTATVTFTVDPTPDAPVAADDELVTDEDTPLTINILDNDSDPDGQPLEVTDVTQPANGTVTVTPEGELTYTPNPDFNGTEEVTYTVTDPDGLTDTATVFITVNPTPDAPVAEDDEDTTDFNTPITIEVLGNDSDPDGDTLTVTGITQPTNGTATFTPEGEITYTPDIGFTGTDTLTYDITDGNGGTDTATVTIFVDPADAGRIDVDVFPVDPADQALDPLDGFDQDPDATDDLDSVVGTDGDDAISTGDDADTIIAGDGADTLEGGIDDDLIDGGAGDDLITDVQGSDTILGGDGNDTITAGIDTFSDYENDDPTFPLTFGGTTFTSDPNTDDGRDSVDGGAGDDVISTGDDADTIIGGLGNDTVDGGIDDDFISGGDGADSLIGGHGSDTIFGEAGDDIIDGSNVPSLELTDDVDPQTQNDRDLLDGGDGNDSITGGDDDDTLLGGAGNDTLDGGIDDDDLFGGDDADTLIGGEGNDTLDGGAGADSIEGGADRDVFLVNSAEEGSGDTIQGGFEGDDFDVLNLSGAGDRGIDWRIVNQTPDDDGPGNPSNGIDGTVEFLDATTGAVTGSLDFFNIEQIVPCFTPGTLIATPQGERLVEELREGDRIITRDNGIQEIRWAGRKDLTGHDLARKPHMRPILIQAGSLGNNLPEHDLLVSPNHRILVNNDKTALYFEETEVLAAAKHLVGLPGVSEVGTLGVSYIHFMFDRHEVVLSNGAWSESFQPGDYSLKGIGNAQRNEILELFPELEHADGLENYAAARRSLKKHEARLLVK